MSALARLDHASLPSLPAAKLPEVYKAARAALVMCERVDECKRWADKMQALASYAKQAKDEVLYKTAVRIQTRAMKRAGVLLQSIASEKGGRPKTGAGIGPSLRGKAGSQAGLSRRQQKTALRVASVPEEDFEAAVESEEPPTMAKTTSKEIREKKAKREGKFTDPPHQDVALLLVEGHDSVRVRELDKEQHV